MMKMVKVCERPVELPGLCEHQGLGGICFFRHNCKWMHVKYMVQGRQSGKSIIRQIEEAIDSWKIC